MYPERIRTRSSGDLIRAQQRRRQISKSNTTNAPVTSFIDPLPLPSTGWESNNNSSPGVNLGCLSLLSVVVLFCAVLSLMRVLRALPGPPPHPGLDDSALPRSEPEDTEVVSRVRGICKLNSFKLFNRNRQ